jgi:hypothetical protein
MIIDHDSNALTRVIRAFSHGLNIQTVLIDLSLHTAKSFLHNAKNFDHFRILHLGKFASIKIQNEP